MIGKRDNRTKINEIKPENKYKNQMEILEEAWKLFNWARNENLKKQRNLSDY